MSKDDLLQIHGRVTELMAGGHFASPQTTGSISPGASAAACGASTSRSFPAIT